MLLAFTPDTVTTDSTLYANVPFGQVPANGFYYLSNYFGKGTLVNGVDYYQKMTARQHLFPNATVMEWSFPSSGGTGLGAFAYGWPLINYGGGYYGNPYNVIGPWPMKINDLKTLAAHYDLSLGGNTNSFDMLIDMFVTASPTSTDGSYITEVSVFPYMSQALHDSMQYSLQHKTVHTFSFGEAQVGIQGTQLCVIPTSGGGAAIRALLCGPVDLKELFAYCVTQGNLGLSGNEYVRGIGLGPEVQVPTTLNSKPYAGWVRFNSLSYTWS